MIRRRLLVAGSVFVLLGGIVVGAWWWENRRGQEAWKEYVAEATGHGMRLWPEEEGDKPPLIETENFIANPVFTDLFSEDTAVREQAVARYRLPATITSLERTDATKGRRFPLPVWRDAFVQEGWLTQATKDPAADVLKALERFQPDLAVLRGLEERPSQRFPFEPKVNGWRTYPESTVMMQLSKLLHAHAAAHLARRESAKAMRDVILQLRLYRAMEVDDCLLSGLIRLAQLATLAQIVWEGIAAGSWTDAELSALETQLGTLRLAQDFETAFATERQAVNSYYDMLRRANLAERRRLNKVSAESEKFFSPEKTGFFADALGRGLWVGMPEGWLYQNQLRGNRVVDALLAQYVEHDGELQRRDLEAPVTVQAEGPAIHHFMFSRISASTYEMIVRSYLRTQTLLQQARVHCRLERYRRDHGALPATLDALVPDYGAPVPRDVMDGQPLRYRRDGEQEAVLYSVGLNRRDDRGEPGSTSNATLQKDWVWKVPKQ